MTQDEVLDEFRAAGALLEGHFILSSGLHSSRYLQCARVLMDAGRAARLCAALAEKVKAVVSSPIDLVASPAMGGVVVMLMFAGLLEGFGRQLIVDTGLRYAVAAATALIWGLYFYAPRPAVAESIHVR
jgi:orotate phosphoribosyltransferase